MSQEPQPQIDPAAILQQLAGMERYLNNLQRLLETIGNTLADMRIAKQALERTKTYEREELLVSTDRTGSVLLKARLDKEEPIVHLGLDVYAQIPTDKAIEILSRREKEIEAQLKQLQNEIAEKAREYQRLQQLAAALSQAQQAPAPQRSQG